MNNKKSEELKKLSSQEENDIKAFALLCKALREERNEKFVESWLPVLKKRYFIEERSNNSYSITTEEYGIIDYFPKKNSLLIRKINKWKKPGLKWIVEHLTK